MAATRIDRAAIALSSLLALTLVAAMPLPGLKSAPPAKRHPLRGHEPAVVINPTNCREAIAQSLQSQGSYYWYSPRVLQTVERVRGSEERAQRSILQNAFAIFIPDTVRRSRLVDNSITAIASAEESGLCTVE